MLRCSGLVLICFLPCVAAAQTVYESKSGQGRVFSDRPEPGARPIEMRPLNVVEPIKGSAAAAPAGDKDGKDGKEKSGKEVAPSYRSFAVVFPEADGSVAINNGTFQINLRSDPPLQIGQGHAFTVRLNGRQVPGRYTATEFMVPQEFFGDAVPAVSVQRFQLDASIVDATGATVTTAAPVQFNGRYVTILQNPAYRQQQLYPYKPQAPTTSTKPVTPKSEEQVTGRRLNADR